MASPSSANDEESQPFIHTYEPKSVEKTDAKLLGGISQLDDIDKGVLNDEERASLKRDMECIGCCATFGYCCCLCTGGISYCILQCYLDRTLHRYIHLLSRHERAEANKTIPVGGN
ncbi:hypothetical protein AAMO2058_000192100 [Amorphochlora amoebiformis]